MPDIMHLVKINASPERVYQALTTAEDIRNWWTRDAGLDGTIGGEGEFRFSSYGKTHVTKVRVVELKPLLRVGWRQPPPSARNGWTRRSRSICEPTRAVRLSSSPIAASSMPTTSMHSVQQVGATILSACSSTCRQGWGYPPLISISPVSLDDGRD